MFYPAHLNLQDRNCLVVGGGVVAERKAVSLLLSGGIVTTISPEVTELLAYLAETGQISWYKRQFRAGDTIGMFLVFGATDFSEINSVVFKDAYETNGISLVNIVDVIPECTFASASVIAPEGMSVSISTSGKSPAMTRRIREYLERKLGAISLYSVGHHDGQPVPVESRQLPYPVSLPLEKRTCVVILPVQKMSSQMKRRVILLEECGASVLYMASTHLDLQMLSNAFLVFIDFDSFDDIYIEQYLQLVEDLGALKSGAFVTPQVVMDGDLIISVSSQNNEVTDTGGFEQMQGEIAQQFENRGYGRFVDFLGSLRPHVLEAISTQRERQNFFETFIDQVPCLHADTRLDEEAKCCLGLGKPDCSNSCVFNLVRQGEIESVRQYALAKIKKKACSALAT